MKLEKLEWSYENGMANVSYSLEPMEWPYSIDEEQAKNIVEYEQHLRLCNKMNAVPIRTGDLLYFADLIEKNDPKDIEIIVKCFRDLVKVFGEKNEN